MNDGTKVLNKVISIDDKCIRNHLGGLVRDSVEETLNFLLDADSDALRYERSVDRIDMHACSYEQQIYTKAGKVT